MAMLLNVILLLLTLTLLSVWAVFYLLYQVIKQQGRLLLRLDEVEQRLGIKSPGPGGTAAQAGLFVGTPVAFRLPDLAGKERALEEFLGARVFLVNWSPHCGFCSAVAAELASVQSDFRQRNVRLLLVSSGDAEANRILAKENALECPILLRGSQSPEVFKGLGTPVAYLLDEQGRTAQPLARGASEVSVLASQIAKDKIVNDQGRRRLPGERPLSDSRIERDGLKAGTPAPLFRLPDLNGRVVSLDEYRGQRVLLLFSDPNCGPCDALAPHLVRLHRQWHDNALAVVMVVRGEQNANLRKVRQHQIEFPVLIQEKWTLSKQYGIFATPVAFLIGEDGVIARDVARGVDAILELVEQELVVSNQPIKGENHERTQLIR